MSDNRGFCIVLTTVGSEEEAGELARAVVKEKLAACVQLSPIKSYYSWKGELDTGDEVLLLIKTRSALYEDLESFILSMHSYETPEILMVPVESGLRGYLEWIGEATSREE